MSFLECFIPEEGALVDITCRTIHSRYLLRPDPALNEIILGVLGRAQRLYPVEISAFFVASNHYLCGAAHKKC